MHCRSGPATRAARRAPTLGAKSYRRNALKDRYPPLREEYVVLTLPSQTLAPYLHSQHERGYIDTVIDLEKSR